MRHCFSIYLHVCVCLWVCMYASSERMYANSVSIRMYAFPSTSHRHLTLTLDTFVIHTFISLNRIIFIIWHFGWTSTVTLSLWRTFDQGPSLWRRTFDQGPLYNVTSFCYNRLFILHGIIIFFLRFTLLLSFDFVYSFFYVIKHPF
jgi:hypothetical protein